MLSCETAFVYKLKVIYINTETSLFIYVIIHLYLINVGLSVSADTANNTGILEPQIWVTVWDLIIQCIV
jgi:hypothetical protein